MFCESEYTSSKSAPKVTLFLNFFLNLLCSLFLFFMLMHYHSKLTLQFEPRLKCKCHNVENKIQKEKKRRAWGSFIIALSVYIKGIWRYSEAPTRGVLWKNCSWEFRKNSEENTCARVSFLNKLQALGLQLY